MGRDAKHPEGKTRPITLSLPEPFVDWLRSMDNPSAFITALIRTHRNEDISRRDRIQEQGKQGGDT